MAGRCSSSQVCSNGRKVSRTISSRVTPRPADQQFAGRGAAAGQLAEPGEGRRRRPRCLFREDAVAARFGFAAGSCGVGARRLRFNSSRRPWCCTRRRRRGRTGRPGTGLDPAHRAIAVERFGQFENIVLRRRRRRHRLAPPAFLGDDAADRGDDLLHRGILLGFGVGHRGNRDGCEAPKLEAAARNCQSRRHRAHHSFSPPPNPAHLSFTSR